MTNYALRRILQTIPVLLAASIIIFLLMHLAPGKPEAIIAGPEATAAEVEIIRQRMGLDRPLPVQYFYYIGNLLQGDLGRSFYFKEDIAKLIIATLPATLELAAVALTFSLLVSIPVGVISAIRRNSWADRISMVGAVVGISIPIFWLGIMLIYLFAVELGWLPASGRGTRLWTVDGLRHIILPAISLGSLGSYFT